ncbi:TPA: hypothetical protein ACHKRG_001322 [Enterococcus faecium]
MTKKKKKKLTERERNEKNINELKNILLLLAKNSNSGTVFGLTEDEINEYIKPPERKKRQVTHLVNMEINYYNEVEDWDRIESNFLANNFDAYVNWCKQFEKGYDDKDIWNFVPMRKKYKEYYLAKHNITENDLESLTDFEP